MANKKYSDFSAGTYDPAKIILQADPTTGALEKIPLAPDYRVFGAGTYDPTKIMLQADATTGALTKVNLPTIPSITGLPVAFAAAPYQLNSGTNPQTMLTVTIAAADFAATNKTLRFNLYWFFPGSANSKTIDLSVNTQSVLNFTGTTTRRGIIQMQIARISSTQVVLNYWGILATTVDNSNMPTLINVNTSTAITIVFKVTAGPANEIRLVSYDWLLI